MTVEDVENIYKMDRKLNRIIDLVNQYYNTDIRNTTRKIEVVEPRKMYYKLAREINSFNPIPYISIAKKVNLTNHSTIIHGIKSINNLMEYEENLTNDYNFLRSFILKTT